MFRNGKSFVFPVLFTVFVFGVLAVPAFAAEEGGQKQSWIELAKTTGFVGVLMLITSIIGTIVAIQNTVELRLEKLAPPGL